MKRLFNQARLLAGEKLLSWAHDIAPDDEADGSEIKGAVLRYFKAVEK